MKFKVGPKCSFCNSTSHRNKINIPLQENKDFFQSYIYYRCCNYFKRDEKLSYLKIKKLYLIDYFQKQYGGLSVFKRKLFQLVKAYSLRSYITNKDIFEIGSATGEFLHSTRDFGPNSITGLEISKDAAKIAQRSYGFKFITTNIEQYNTKTKYDTIFLFHVIEHVIDPEKLIRKCMSLLKKGGSLIVETPNINSLEYLLFGKKWQAWMPREHTYLFSTETLNKIGKKCKVKRQRYFYSPISNVMPTQVIQNKLIMKFYPLFLIFYTFIYYVSFLFKKSGIVTAVYEK